MASLLKFGRCLSGAAAAAAGVAALHAAPIQPFREVHCKIGKDVPVSSTTMLLRKSETKHEKTALFKAYQRRYGDDKNVEMSYKDVAAILEAVGITNPALVSRIFFVIDADGGGTVDFTEMNTFCKKMALGPMKDKVEFLFKACDMDGDGEINRADMRVVLKGLVLECHQNMPEFTMIRNEHEAALYAGLDNDVMAQVVANRITADVFGSADRDRSGTIDLKEFNTWATRGGKTFNEFTQLFPVFEAFVKTEDE